MKLQKYVFTFCVEHTVCLYFQNSPEADGCFYLKNDDDDDDDDDDYYYYYYYYYYY
jgi:hypothetical protein